MRAARHILVYGLTLLSTGCIFGQGLEGDWEGEMECDGDSAAVDVSLTLDSDGGEEYAGTLENSLSVRDFVDGYEYELSLEVDFEFVVETDGRGEQELDYEAEVDGASCALYEDGTKVSGDCEEIGLDIDIGSNADFGDLTWDGEDSIDIEDDDCSGELTRG